MVDPPGEIETGLPGHEQAAAAMRAIRPLWSPPRWRRSGWFRPSEMRRRDHRFSPRIPEPLLQAERGTPGWRDRDGGMKVLWPGDGRTDAA